MNLSSSRSKEVNLPFKISANGRIHSLSSSLKNMRLTKLSKSVSTPRNKVFLLTADRNQILGSLPQCYINKVSPVITTTSNRSTTTNHTDSNPS